MADTATTLLQQIATTTPTGALPGGATNAPVTTIIPSAITSHLSTLVPSVTSTSSTTSAASSNPSQPPFDGPPAGYGPFRGRPPPFFTMTGDGPPPFVSGNSFDNYQSQPNSQGMNLGTKVGIGIGVTALTMSIIIVALLLLRMRKKENEWRDRSTAPPPYELSQQMTISHNGILVMKPISEDPKIVPAALVRPHSWGREGDLITVPHRSRNHRQSRSSIQAQARNSNLAPVSESEETPDGSGESSPALDTEQRHGEDANALRAATFRALTGESSPSLAITSRKTPSPASAPSG